MSRQAEALIYALNKLKDEKYKKYINEIYLYGSCARGTYKYGSDVDLFLVLSSDVPKDMIREMKNAVVPVDYRLPGVELKTSTFPGFSNSRQFSKNIKEEGRLLWKRD